MSFEAAEESGPTDVASGSSESGEINAGFDMEAAADSIAADIFPESEAESTEDGEEGTDRPDAEYEKKPTQTTKPAEESTKQESEPVAAPRTWRKEAAEAFAALPDVIKAEVLKREEDIHKGIGQYKEDATYAQRIKGMIQPYAETFRQAGVDPMVQVQDLLGAHITLSTKGPEERLQAFAQLANDYGVDLGELLDVGTNTPPEVLSLRQELNSLKSTLANVSQTQLGAKQAEVAASVETFAKDPANQYFDEVANDIAVLLERGVVETLAEAYEKAVWMNPAVRAKENARQLEDTQAKAKEAATKKVAEAKKALAANVKSKARSGSATTPLGSIDDTLTETMANIRARG